VNADFTPYVHEPEPDLLIFRELETGGRPLDKQHNLPSTRRLVVRRHPPAMVASLSIRPAQTRAVPLSLQRVQHNYRLPAVLLRTRDWSRDEERSYGFLGLGANCERYV
jgi:hypothetical protein